MAAGVAFPTVLSLQSFACDGPNVFTGVWWGRVLVWKKSLRRHNETAARATRGIGEVSCDLLAGWHRTHAVWLICIPQCTVMGMGGDNFLQWSDASSTGS
ncbi:hypothetical protein TcG_12964 [Trypanosoma cruzi]|nr:hypothetical protein TcG_12964 [Trypanosoma cruzi]